MIKLNNDTILYESDIEVALQEFAENNNLEITELNQVKWNGALMYAHDKLFIDADALKKVDFKYNDYDVELIAQVLKVYIQLCFTYDKVPTQWGFENLTGVSDDIIRLWRGGDKKHSLIYQMLMQAKEESLQSKLIDAKTSPVGLIATLNHHFGWSSPYVSNESQKESKRISRGEVREQLTMSDLPQLPE